MTRPMNEQKRGTTSMNLRDKFGIVLESGVKIDTIRNHIKNNCAVLYKHVYRAKLLDIPSASLRPEAFKVFIEKLKVDHPELVIEINKRRIAHRITMHGKK